MIINYTLSLKIQALKIRFMNWIIETIAKLIAGEIE